MTIIVEQRYGSTWDFVGRATTWRGAQMIARRMEGRIKAAPIRAIPEGGEPHAWDPERGFLSPGSLSVVRDEPETVRGYVWRAVTDSNARWIGMSAAVAGGYVAIDGPQIAIAPRYDEIDAIYRDEMARVRKLFRHEESHARDVYVDGVHAARAEAIKVWHRLPRGRAGAVGEVPGYGGYERMRYERRHVMVVPPASGLARRGVPLSEPLVNELIPLLERAGYKTKFDG